MLNEIEISSFDWTIFGEKAFETRLSYSPIFVTLKWALELFISVRMKPLPIFWDLLFNTITHGKTQETKK